MTRVGFYVAALDQVDEDGNGRFRVAVGPFRTRGEADRYVAPVKKRAAEIDPLAEVFGSIGTGRVESESLVVGPANRLVGLATDDDGYVLTAESLIESMLTPDYTVRP